MSQPLYIFPKPIETVCSLSHDIAGWNVMSHAGAHPSNGAACQVFDLPDGTPDGNGATLTIPGKKTPQVYHGVLYLHMPTGAALLIDIFPPETICPEPAPIPPIPPQPPLPKDPFGIIKAVYATGHYDLSTKDGCGRFNEDCVTALHETHSAEWGHIQKFPPQNHYPEQPYVPGGKVHAVDANMLLTDAPDGTKAGIYDIVFDSESPNAKPAFNFKGTPESALWYYPAK